MSIRYIFLSLMLLGSAGLIRAQEKEAPPNLVEATLPISEVLVAPGRAVVTRAATLPVKAGLNQIRVKGLPPALDRESLQVDLAQDAGVQLKSVALKLIATRKLEPERIQAKEKELRELDQKLKGLADRHQLLGAELLVIQKFSPDLKALKPSTGDADFVARSATLDPLSWMSIIEFSGSLAEKKRQAIAQLASEKKDLEFQRNEAQAKLSELRKTSVPARVDALIEAKAAQAAPLRLVLRYTVSHVTWYPAFELKASTDGRKVSIERQATVAQHTGEDWSGVQLTFSSLVPENAVRIPSLAAWNIAFDGQHGAVESRDFGHHRPQADAMAALGRIPGPETLMALRKAYRGGRSNDLSKAFDYRDVLGEASMLLGQGSLKQSESFTHRSQGGRARRVFSGGGSARTESAVDVGMNFLASNQRDNGSWNDLDHERHAVGITSLCLLSFLGGGHTTKVGKYKVNVQKGLSWVLGQIRPNGQAGHSLFDQCHATLALAEGCGMTRQRRWEEGAVRALRHLDRMLRPRVLPLIPGMLGSRFPNGIENLAFAAMAAKSCKVAGLPVPATLWESLRILTRQLERSKLNARTSAVSAYTLLMLGHSLQEEKIKAHVVRILNQLPEWKKNRVHVGYLQIATLVCFQYGGDTWKTWNSILKPALLQSEAKDGSWPADGIWIGPTASQVATTAFCTTSLQVYYRYLPVYRNDSGESRRTDVAWQPVSPQVSANGRLYLFRADGLRSVLGDGEFHRIPIDRKEVTALPTHVTTPVVYQGVFLQSKLKNPFKAPLLDGAARLFLGHEFMGETPLAFTPSGEELVVPLGEDPYVTVRRDVFEETSKNASLTNLYTLQARVRLILENHRKTPVQLRARERYAISSDARVRVRNRTVKGGVSNQKKQDGTFHWDVTLKAGAKETLEVSYEVEYPEGVVPQPKRVEK